MVALLLRNKWDTLKWNWRELKEKRSGQWISKLRALWKYELPKDCVLHGCGCT